MSDQGTTVKVDVVEELGADAYIYGRIIRDGELGGHDIVARVSDSASPAKGEVIRLAPDPVRLHYFSPTTGARLGD